MKNQYFAALYKTLENDAAGTQAADRGERADRRLQLMQFTAFENTQYLLNKNISPTY